MLIKCKALADRGRLQMLSQIQILISKMQDKMLNMERDKESER